MTDFKVLDVQPTPMGDLMLRRRLEPTLQIEIWEVKLGEEFLMTSLFTAGERAVSTLGLRQLTGSYGVGELDVIVGGLGLGYTAAEALKDPRVGSAVVVDTLAEVIGWHREGLVPLGAELNADRRCRFVHHDFFALTHTGYHAVDPTIPERVHAILLDIDHTPGFWLDPAHASFYSTAGLQRVHDQLHPGGVFSLWSDEQQPNPEFVDLLRSAFPHAEAHVVSFPNHYTGNESTSTIYTATSDIAAQGDAANAGVAGKFS